MALEVNANIRIDERELEESFVHASGPGGQNVNKLSTAVQLRWDVANSPALSEAVRARLVTLAGRRLTAEGVLVLIAQRFRSQERNREDARERLVALVRQAAIAPVYRRPTKPSLGEKRRRTDAKTRRGAIKQLRDRPRDDG